ncbi:MAG: class I SAM-dependent methyltransferase [Pseudomonadota bacterium]
MAEIMDHPDGRWEIAGVDADAARGFLETHAPWRMELSFHGGPKASDFETFQPFNARPLRKLHVLMGQADLPDRPAVLDVGFNCGYNSLYCASRLGSAVTGLDVSRKNKAVADGLADLIGVEAEFLLENAEDFERADAYDLALHFGTLYHLPNPLRSIEKTAKSLRKGGLFALETIRYTGDPRQAKWIWMFNGDKTNFWALGDEVLSEQFQRCGLSTLELIENVEIKAYEGEHMSRATWIARKL